MTRSMRDQYDEGAAEYERYWAPVLDATARSLLDEVEPFVAANGGTATNDRTAANDRRSLHVLDIGTGTGVLAHEALRRWPDVRVTAIDASKGMLELAERRASEENAAWAERSTWLVADADRLPLRDGAVDLAISSFVFQLVPDRLAAFREARRVLRPGGILAFVTWMLGEDHDRFAPAAEFDEAVLDLAIDEGEWDEEAEEEHSAGDLPSADVAARQLRRAGFRSVTARVAHLEYAWTRETYLEYKIGFDETELFESIDDETRRRLLDRVAERFDTLSPDAYRWRAEVVFARGVNPG